MLAFRHHEKFDSSICYRIDGVFKVYMTDFFLFALIEYTWGTDVNIEKKIRNLLSSTVFLPSKHVKIHFRLVQNHTRQGPGSS